jgi:hypothetical protein
MDHADRRGTCLLAEQAAERPDPAFRMSPDTFSLAMIQVPMTPSWRLWIWPCVACQMVAQ